MVRRVQQRILPILSGDDLRAARGHVVGIVDIVDCVVESESPRFVGQFGGRARHGGGARSGARRAACLAGLLTPRQDCTILVVDEIAAARCSIWCRPTTSPEFRSWPPSRPPLAAASMSRSSSTSVGARHQDWFEVLGIDISQLSRY
jgi:hypothetical protein